MRNYKNRQMENEVLEKQVNPIHYGSGKGFECIDVMLQQFGAEEVKAFCKLNAFKYLFRLGRKGDPMVDAGKAQWYIARYMRMLNEERGEE